MNKLSDKPTENQSSSNIFSYRDILSAPATVRWQRESSARSRNSFTLASSRRIRQMVSSQNASKFINITDNSTNDTAKVSKGEDLKEVSSQLGFLRKHHDLNRTINALRLKHVNNKSFDLNFLKNNTSKALTLHKSLKTCIESLEEQIKEILNKQEQCEIDTCVYNHILERMREIRIHLDMKKLKLKESLKGNYQILIEEVEKNRKVREMRIQTKLAVRNLQGFVGRETLEKNIELQVIEKDVKQKKESAQKREERLRRQVEISEAAADEDRNAKAIKLRAGLLMHKMWFSMLQKKLIGDMNKFSRLEAGFSDLKKATGMHQTEEVIEKILTGESRYNEILENISYTKARIEEYTSKNKEIQDRIENCTMAKTENLNPAIALEAEVVKKRREIEFYKERYMKMVGTWKNVGNWMRKFLNSIEMHNSSKQSENFAFENVQEGELISVGILLKEEVRKALVSIRKNKLESFSE